MALFRKSQKAYNQSVYNIEIHDRTESGHFQTKYIYIYIYIYLCHNATYKTSMQVIGIAKQTNKLQENNNKLQENYNT